VSHETLCGSTLSILITSSYQLPPWLRRLGDELDGVAGAIERAYSRHSGLVQLLMLLAALSALTVQILTTRTKRRRRRANGSFNDATRLRLLHETEQRSRAERGLREAIRIDLNLTEAPLPIALSLISTTDGEARTIRSTDATIHDIFRSTSGMLLILGDPGTGKTNLLDELAHGLIDDARRDATEPVPIRFNLARWTLGEHTRTLQEWMRDDLHDLYALTRRDAERLIEKDEIIPLLDGLDEVDEARRPRCVDAINAYQETRNLGRFSVTCRAEEYRRLVDVSNPAEPSRGVNARDVVRVERLTARQVDRLIRRRELVRVRDLLAEEPELRSFIDTPLWLHVLYFASLGRRTTSDAASPRERLYDYYVEYILSRRRDPDVYRRHSSTDVLHWLGWLAASMQRRHQTDFVLEALDFTWLNERRESPPVTGSGRNKRVRVFHRLLFGGAVGLLGGIMCGRLFGALVGVLAMFRIQLRVEAAERLQFDWRRALQGWAVSLAYGAFFAVMFAWAHGIRAGMFMWGSAAVFETLQGGFQPRSGDGNVSPNSATQRSVRYAMTIVLCGITLASSAACFAFWALNRQLIASATCAAIVNGSCWIAFGGIILGGEKGGWFALRHYSVRVCLWRRHVMPAAYVRFLNESVERLFLVRAGGTYKFFHLTFRDYMAAKYGMADIGVRPQSKPTVGPQGTFSGAAGFVLARLHVTSDMPARVG
jgi:hypothetical protein